MHGHHSHRKAHNKKACKLTGVGVISHCCVLARIPMAEARCMAMPARLGVWTRTGGFEFVLHLIFILVLDGKLLLH